MNFQSINSKILHNSSIMREGSTQGKWERKERDRDDPGGVRCCAQTTKLHKLIFLEFSFLLNENPSVFVRNFLKQLGSNIQPLCFNRDAQFLLFLAIS